MYAWGRAVFGELGTGAAPLQFVSGGSPSKKKEEAEKKKEEPEPEEEVGEKDKPVTSTHAASAAAPADGGGGGGGGGGERKDRGNVVAIPPAGASFCVPQLCKVDDPDSIAQLRCGMYHSAATTAGGSLLTWGGDGSGQLGHGQPRERGAPTVVESLRGKQVTDVSLSRSHTLAVVDGVVFSWGRARFGQLGFGGKNWDQMNPRAVPSLSSVPVAQVACGEAHSMALSELGDVYTWGRGKCGRLGLGSEHAQMFPQLVVRLSGRLIKKIAAGYHHSLAVSAHGSLYVWGANNEHQLGTGVYEHEFYPRRINFRDDRRVVDVCAGAFHTIALTTDGFVHAWGQNRYGQLGMGDTHPRLVPSELDVFCMLSSHATRAFKVVAGAYHSCVLTVDGKLYAFGHGMYGQLGLGTFQHADLPQQVILPSGRKIADVACGAFHTVAVEGAIDVSSQLVVDMGKEPAPLLSTVGEGAQGIQGTIMGMLALCTGNRPGVKASKKQSTGDGGKDEEEQ